MIITYNKEKIGDNDWLPDKSQNLTNEKDRAHRTPISNSSDENETRFKQTRYLVTQSVQKDSK